MRHPLNALAPPSNEMLHLDMLRFAASFAIVVYHFQHHLALPLAVTARLDRLMVAVDLFFFMSGFVISRFYSGIASPHEYGAFLWKRLARLYPLHLATTLVFVAIGVGAAAGHLRLRVPGQFDMACLPANLLLVHALAPCDHLSFDVVSWSISAEMLLYLLLPLFILLRRARGAATIAAAAGFLMLELAAPSGSLRPWYEWTFDFGVLRALPSFLLGAICYDHRAAIGRVALLREPLMWALLAAVLLVPPAVPQPLLIAMAFAAACCAIAEDGRGGASRAVRVIAPLGSLTYSMYLLHPIVDIVLLSFVGKTLLHLSAGAMAGLVALAIPLVLALAWLSFAVYETPARRMLGSLWSRRAGRIAAADARTPI